MTSWLGHLLDRLRGSPEPGPIRILAVMPKRADCVALSQIASKEKWRLEFAKDSAEALRRIGEQEFSVILFDRDADSRSDWRSEIDRLATAAPHACVILTSRFNDDRLWQEVLNRGGFDVVTKPFHEERVVRAVESAVASSGPSGNNSLTNGV